MSAELSALVQNALAAISAADSLESLDALRVQYLGKKGQLTTQLKQLGRLPPEERKAAGQQVNQAKAALQEAISIQHTKLQAGALDKALADEKIDVTLPGRVDNLGAQHPITRTRLRIESYFEQLGFDVQTGPDIESDYYNFEALNIPAHHPARAMQDTFYFPDERVLRTHTSPVQIRYMENNKPPFRMIAPGRVYRSDSDLTHTPMFHQIEGLVVDAHLTMAHLKTLLQDLMSAFFETDCDIRFRASYFPFTEPSAEVDISCVACHGKTAQGCRVCKSSGWLEVLGCGMVHPNVLEAGGISSEEYNGFAFGMGLERLAMLRYNVPDIRQYFDSDARFLKQFTPA